MKHNLSDAIEKLLDNYFMLQKDIRNVSGLYDIVMREIEKTLIKKVLKISDNNKSLTAKMLGISRNTLNSKLKNIKEM